MYSASIAFSKREDKNQEIIIKFWLVCTRCSFHLQDHDTAAAELTEQATALQKDIESKNVYQENLKELNKVAGHRPKSTLVLGEMKTFILVVSSRI